MKTYNTEYSNFNNVIKFIKDLKVLDTGSVLVQIFSGLDDDVLLIKISQTIKAEIANATIIGSSTAGEILEGKIVDESIIISFSVFDSVSLISSSVCGDNSEKLGESIANNIITQTTKAVIIFADGLKCNGEAILKGFSKTSKKDIIVSGGMAGDNSKFQRTFVIHDEKIFENGVVAVSLNSKDLLVHNSYNLSWRAIGLPMTITKAQGNRIDEIDNKPIIEVYREYLGDEVVVNLPDSAIEFPLIFNKANIEIARSMVSADENSITFAGEIPIGTQVRFGVASATLFDEGSKELYEVNSKVPLESLFIYSCVGRKSFLDKELESELLPLAGLSPVSGFFTYGELYSGYEEYQMLNITTTVLGLSETKEIKPSKNINPGSKKRLSLSTSALIHLVDKTISNLEVESQEKQNTIAILNQYQKAIDESYIISKADLDGNIIFVNDLFCDISGYKKEELLGKPHNFIRHPDVPKSLFKELWQTIQAKKIWRGILQNRNKNGTSYYVDATIFPLLDKDSNVTGYVGVRDDITDIKHQKDRAEAILNAQNSIVLLTSIVDKTMQVKQLNQKFFEVFDYPDMDDFLSKHSCICDLFIEKEGYLSAKLGDKTWLEVLLENSDQAYLVLVLDKNNNKRVFSVQARNIYLETENFIISTFTDVTELENARVEALSAERAKSAFLATMSHELRTPLNSVIGFSQILMSKDNMPMASTKSFIEKIYISGKHLLNLVNNILDFSKIESGKMQLNKNIFPLSNLINDAILLEENDALNKEISFTINGFSNIKIDGDEQLLRQVILNILSNAIKFSDKNSCIEMSYKDDKNSHIVCICDNGVGLSQEELSVIFEPFSQILEHQNKAIKGTGLGLAISKKIINLHNGKIEVESVLGKGSCFNVYLPKTKDEK